MYLVLPSRTYFRRIYLFKPCSGFQSTFPELCGYVFYGFTGRVRFTGFIFLPGVPASCILWAVVWSKLLRAVPFLYLVYTVLLVLGVPLGFHLLICGLMECDLVNGCGGPLSRFHLRPCANVHLFLVVNWLHFVGPEWGLGRSYWFNVQSLGRPVNGRWNCNGAHLEAARCNCYRTP